MRKVLLFVLLPACSGTVTVDSASSTAGSTGGSEDTVSAATTAGAGGQGGAGISSAVSGTGGAGGISSEGGAGDIDAGNDGAGGSECTFLDCNDSNPCTLDYCDGIVCHNDVVQDTSICIYTDGGSGKCFMGQCCTDCFYEPWQACVPICPGTAICTDHQCIP